MIRVDPRYTHGSLPKAGIWVQLQMDCIHKSSLQMYVHNTEDSRAILSRSILTQYHCLVECIFSQRFQVYSLYISWLSCYFGTICAVDYNMQVNCESSRTLPFAHRWYQAAAFNEAEQKRDPNYDLIVQNSSISNSITREYLVYFMHAPRNT